MAYPVQGPVIKQTSNAVMDDIKVTWRQAKPFNVVLPYTRILYYQSSFQGFPFTKGFNWAGPPPQETVRLDLLLNRAYAKLIEDLRPDSAQLAALFLEYEQAGTMIYNRAKQLARVFRAAKGFNVPGVIEGLSLAGSHVPSSVRKNLDKHARKRDMAGLILEVNYGWVPLVQDLHGAAKVLVLKEKKNRIRGSASSGGEWDIHNHYSSTPAALVIEKRGGVFSSKAVQGCTVSVENPNLILANDLGLLNPAATAWEVTPFSHVVDWFTGFGAVLQSLSDFYGYGVSDAYTTKKITSSNEIHNYTLSQYDGVLVDFTMNVHHLYCERTLGLTGPTVALRYGVKSIPRAVNAVSQLLQLLPRR